MLKAYFSALSHRKNKCNCCSELKIKKINLSDFNLSSAEIVISNYNNRKGNCPMCYFFIFDSL